MPPTTRPTIAPTLMGLFSSAMALRSPTAGRSATSPSPPPMFPVVESGAFGFAPLNFSFGLDVLLVFAGPAFAR